MKKQKSKQRDHYVAVTYLNQFIDPNKLNHVNVYCKKSLEHYPASPRSICFEMDGDSNPYFPHNPRILDEFLDLPEKHLNESIAEFENDYFNNNAKLIISLYTAYLRSCNFTAKRLGKESLEQDLEVQRPIYAEFVKKNKDRYEDYEQLIKGLMSPDIKLEYDRHYPHAIAIQNLLIMGFRLFALPWIILKNSSFKPFLTSDNPAIFLYNPERWYPEIYLPLSPKIGIIIPTDPYDKMVGKNLESVIIPANDRMKVPKVISSI